MNALPYMVTATQNIAESGRGNRDKYLSLLDQELMASISLQPSDIIDYSCIYGVRTVLSMCAC